MDVRPTGLLQPTKVAEAISASTIGLAKEVIFIFGSFLVGYLAQLGCDCELLPENREISLFCLVFTSRRDNTRRPPWRLAKITVREFGAHEGSSPLTSGMASPP